MSGYEMRSSFVLCTLTHTLSSPHHSSIHIHNASLHPLITTTHPLITTPQYTLSSIHIHNTPSGRRGKPGWNDAMNGLPGILGSSMAGMYINTL